MPAARPDHDGRELLVGPQPVGLALLTGEVDAAVEGVPQMELTRDHVLPERRVRVLEVGEPHVRTGVERVDRHLPLGRPGDLHPAVDQPGRGRRHPPGQVIPDLAAPGEEVKGPARRDLYLPGLARREQLRPPGAELALERGQQAQRVGGEDLVVAVPPRADDLDTLDSSHVALLPVMITSWARVAGGGTDASSRPRAGSKAAPGPGAASRSPPGTGAGPAGTQALARPGTTAGPAGHNRGLPAVIEVNENIRHASID